MSPEDRERIDPAAPQPTAGPATHDDAAPLESLHPHRAYHLDTLLDPIARLEWLDDLMFAAIDGDPVALDNVAEAWHKMQDELGVPALEESRQQYLRRAQMVWHSLRHEPNHPPHKIFAAIEIISLLASRAR